MAADAETIKPMQTYAWISQMRVHVCVGGDVCVNMCECACACVRVCVRVLVRLYAYARLRMRV